MIARQTLAMFVDSYRELNSKRLFWLVLALSGLIVGSFGLIGVKEDSISLLGWKTAIPLSAFGATPESIYKMIFLQVGVPVWLAWGATILALVSTAGIIPDFVSGGTIDLTLSRPIGRVRLFLTKYAASLLFVAAQVTVFSLGAFLVFGLRAGAWEPGLFITVPVIILFFSYLYCVCALVGLLTRSTITALLVTILFWLAVFLLNATDSSLVTFTEIQRRELLTQERRVEQLETVTERDSRGVVGALVDAQAARMREQSLEAARARRDEAAQNVRDLEKWQGRVVAVKTLLPKTSETIALLRRALVDLADLEAGLTDFAEDMSQVSPPPVRARTDAERAADGGAPDAEHDAMAEFSADPEAQVRAQIETERRFRERSLWWVVGTSILFECAVLGAACWIFHRRDF